MKKIIGIDPSMKGCGIYSRGKKEDSFFSFTSHLKNMDEYRVSLTVAGKKLNVFCLKIPKEIDETNKKDPFWRLMQLAQPSIDFLKKEMSSVSPDEIGVFLEDAVTGNRRSTQLAEYVSLLKNAIYDGEHRITKMFVPTTIKKNIWGFGNVDKLEIYEAAKVHDFLGPALSQFEKDGHPVRDDSWMIDFLDAWAVTEMAIEDNQTGGFKNEF